MINKQQQRNEIRASIPSGVGRMAPYIAGGMVLLTAVYGFLSFYFKESPSILGLPPPAKEYCQGYQTVCSRSDLFAFEMASFLAILFCGVMGFYTWHISRRSHVAVPQTPEGRLFAYLPEGEIIATAGFTFQFWDFLITLFIPEHRTAIMLAHHVMAATVSWYAIRYQLLHHYGVYFLGVSEVSTIFLVFVDIAQFFPPEPGTFYDKLIAVVRPSFAVAFVLYRVLLWWPVSIQIFQDVYSVLQSGQASKLRPGKEWVLFVFLALNIPLGLLQLFWLSIIAKEASNMLLQVA